MDWTNGLPDDLKGYVTTKGFKDTASVVDSYKNLEKLIGVKEKLLQVPDDLSDSKSMENVWKRLGRPEKPEDYGIKGKDEAFSKWSAEQFHKLGLNANQAKELVKNYDDYLLEPLGKALFAFNMQFNYDPEIRGDLEVSAKGTESLMANEVRSQRLMQFLNVMANPVLAPFAKMDVIAREIAKSLDLDPDKVVNSLSDAALQAEILKQFQQEMPPTAPEMGATGPQGLPGMPGAGAAGVNAMDPTGAGGGNIGTGIAPVPGEQGFSANTGGMQ
jgi:hypothetical protein